MKELPLPNKHYLQAAVGWVELGNLDEALKELQLIDTASLAHPDVLDTQWLIFAAQRNWEEALRLAQTMLHKHPDLVNGWVHQAYSLRRVPGGGLEKARGALLPAAKLFPKEDIIAYNLACYEAQLGNEREAWEWIRCAFEACGDVDKIKRRALQDPDLKLLWERLKTM